MLSHENKFTAKVKYATTNVCCISGQFTYLSVPFRCKKLLYIEKQSSGKSKASNNLSRWMTSMSNKHIETYIDKKVSYP